jgi:hypothetical protein
MQAETRNPRAELRDSGQGRTPGVVSSALVRHPVNEQKFMKAETDQETIILLQAENQKLLQAILWALGQNGDFAQQQPGQGKYYWRTELRKRAIGKDA